MRLGVGRLTKSFERKTRHARLPASFSEWEPSTSLLVALQVFARLGR